jgi:hypothetical protein
MTKSTRSLSLLTSGALLAATFVLAGCNDSTKTPASPAATDTPASVPATDAAVPTNSASSTDVADDAAEMEQHHRQEMDHEEMRRGGMEPRHSDAPDPQPSGNQSMPMGHM